MWAGCKCSLGMPVMESIRVSDTNVFIGLLLGGALPWLFSSLSIRAVSRAAGQIVEEVRRQFRIPGIMEGTKTPDYARVVGISTASAQKELIPLATISVLMPLAVGLVLQVEALGGFLAGIILSGQLLAVFMSNAGGAWDNAKKVHRGRAARPGQEHRQRLRAAQGRRGGRHGGRSAEGHRRPGAQPDDQSGQPGQPDRRTHHRQVPADGRQRPDQLGRGHHRRRAAGRHDLGHRPEQERSAFGGKRAGTGWQIRATNFKIKWERADCSLPFFSVPQETGSLRQNMPCCTICCRLASHSCV